MGLQGAYPRTVVEGCGTGDHLDKVGTKIRCIKVLICSVLQVLVDPQKSLMVPQGAYPGTVVVGCGA